MALALRVFFKYYFSSAPPVLVIPAEGCKHSSTDNPDFFLVFVSPSSSPASAGKVTVRMLSCSASSLLVQRGSGIRVCVTTCRKSHGWDCGWVLCAVHPLFIGGTACSAVKMFDVTNLSQGTLIQTIRSKTQINDLHFYTLQKTTVLFVCSAETASNVLLNHKIKPVLCQN